VTAPTIPVVTTSTAVKDGRPPILSEMPIATGAVADFGASENSVCGLAPRKAAMPIEHRAAIVTPDMIEMVNGSQSRLSFASWEYKGTASATVAGPNKKCTN
jgi:hypothetical protein